MIPDQQFLSQEQVATTVLTLADDEQAKILNGKIIPGDRVFYPVKPHVTSSVPKVEKNNFDGKIFRRLGSYTGDNVVLDTGGHKFDNHVINNGGKFLEQALSSDPDLIYHDTGNLAKSWEIPDDKTFVFNIREGVNWHDKAPMNGRALTAEDVVFNYHRLTGTGSGFTEPSSAQSQLPQLKYESITAGDGNTVVFKLTPAIASQIIGKACCKLPAIQLFLRLCNDAPHPATHGMKCFAKHGRQP